MYLAISLITGIVLSLYAYYILSICNGINYDFTQSMVTSYQTNMTSKYPQYTKQIRTLANFMALYIHNNKYGYNYDSIYTNYDQHVQTITMSIRGLDGEKAFLNDTRTVIQNLFCNEPMSFNESQLVDMVTNPYNRFHYDNPRLYELETKLNDMTEHGLSSLHAFCDLGLDIDKNSLIN